MERTRFRAVVAFAVLFAAAAAMGAEEDSHWPRSAKDRQAKFHKLLAVNPASKEVSFEELMWANLQSKEEAWRTSKRHADTRLTKEQFGRLRAMKNVWVRALLYVHFPEQCPADWVRALRSDLRQIGRPPERMHKLVAALDDDRFAVRECAMRELIDWRDAFAIYLWSIPKDSLSLEASRRLREVRRGLSRTELPPLPRRVLSTLAWSDKPQGPEILDILRKSEPANHIAREAQEALQQRRNRDEERKRSQGGK